MRILLVEDDLALAQATHRRLTDEGFVVDLCGDLATAIEAVIGSEFDLVLLDRRLPDGDGLSLLPVIRTRPARPPVIVLTALGDVPDRVEGLDAGADDYLIKPYAPAELLARVRVLLRRGRSSGDAAALTLGRLRYDAARLEVTVNDRPLTLPRRETAILDTMLRRAGRVVLREHLESQVYGFDDTVNSNALEAHVSRLRKRLAEAQAGVALQAVRGLGYIMRAE